MDSEVENAIAEALLELNNKSPYPTGQETLVCDFMHHALHCWRCQWTGIVFDIAEKSDILMGILYTAKTECFCPQCGKPVRHAEIKNSRASNPNRGLKLV